MRATAFVATTGNGIVRAARRGDGTWAARTLLGGLVVRCLAVDRRGPPRLYAGTQGAGVLRSDDGGLSWRGSGLEGQVVTALAASPRQPAVVYAGTRPARLYVSRDGGETWRELAGFRRIPWRWLWFSPAEQPFLAYVQAIAPSPADPNRIVVGVEFGATVLSDDGGRTWTGHRRGSLRDCHGLAFHLAHGDRIYEAGGTGAGAAFSRDGGWTWSQPREGLDRHYGWAVAADPADPDTWYLSAAPGPSRAHGEGAAEACIYRHDGNRWRRLAGGLAQPLPHMPYALLTNLSEPDAVYAGFANGDVWHSSDRGDHWERLPISLGSIRRSLVML
jgi:hypothetical protein